MAFGNKYRSKVLEVTFIRKRHITIKNMSETKRVCLIKLSAMYEYLDISFDFTNQTNEIDYILTSYFFFY